MAYRPHRIVSLLKTIAPLRVRHFSKNFSGPKTAPS
jgi:hypothetical protein